MQIFRTHIAILCIGFTLTSLQVSAQTDYSWWNEKHNWDGVTDWTQYMIISPGYMGPNALPVPEMSDASVSRYAYAEAGLEGHYSHGDQTMNLYTELYVPLFSDRAAIQIAYRPLELYQTDTLTRDERVSREYDPSGYSLGDVYVSTLIQLVRDHTHLPDILLSANIKTASGTNLEGARHTDTPGYWFDVTMGRSFSIESPAIRDLRAYVKGGLYVYQTFTDRHLQNDAFIYGGGFKFSLKKIDIHNQVTGYSGYFNNGDRPVVYRFILEGINDRTVSYKVMFQQGLHDFRVSSLRISMLIKFNQGNHNN